MSDLESMIYRLRHAKHVGHQIHIEAELNDISAADVRTIAAKYGLVFAPAKSHKSTHPHQCLNYDRVLALYNSGIGDSAIGRALHMPKSTICAWRHRSGLSTNNPRVFKKKVLAYGA